MALDPQYSGSGGGLYPASSQSRIPAPVGGNKIEGTPGPSAVGIDPEGRIVTSAGQRTGIKIGDPLVNALAGANGRGDALIWLPLREGLVARTAGIPNAIVNDYSGQLQGTITGGTRLWGPWPGVMFDSATRLPLRGGSRGGFTVSAQRCGDLSTLQKNVDQITVWAVISHPAAMINPDRTILCYGATQSAKGGWAIGLGGARARFYTYIVPKNNVTLSACRTELPGDKIDGTALSNPVFNNTMTAVAFEFMAHTTGYVVCNMFMLPIGTDYGIDLKLQSFNSLALVPAGSGGSAAATYDTDAPFTIGARATVDNNTFADNLGPDISVAQIGIMRHRWDQSLGARIVRDLRAAPRALPASVAAAGFTGV